MSDFERFSGDSRMSEEMIKVLLALVAFVFAGLGAIGLVMLDNAEARAKCASLRNQGVKAYLAKGVVIQECVVVQREWAPTPEERGSK